MATPKFGFESPKFGSLNFEGATGQGVGFGPGDFSYGARYELNGQDYFFIPESFVSKGIVKDKVQYYSPSFLNKDNIKKLYDESEFVDLGSDISNPVADSGSKGFLMKQGTFNSLNIDSGSYDIGFKSGKVKVNEITGLREIKGNLVYATKAKGRGVENAQAWIQPYGKAYDGKNLVGNVQARWVTGGPLYQIGKEVGKVPFLPEIAGYFGGPYAYATLKGLQAGPTGKDPFRVGLEVGASLLAADFLKGPSAEGAPVGGTSVGGTPGVSEVLPVDMSVGGTVTPIPPGSIGLPSISLLDGVTFPGQGLKVPSIDSADISLIPEGSIPSGIGLKGPTMPSILGMGGGQGLTVGVPGGTVGAGGFTAIDAVPVLGEPGSFINDPNVLGKDVIKAAGSSLSLADILEGADILKGAKLVNDLIGGGGQPSTQRTMSRPRFTPTGVSPLDLLKLYASTPDVSGLLTQRRSRAAPGFDLLSSQRFPSRSNLSLIGP